MTPADQSGSVPEPSDLPLEAAARLLREGIGAPPRPVDDLIDRLLEPSGAEWLPAALASGPMRGMGEPALLLAGAGATLEQLEAIRRQSAAQVKSGPSEARLEGLAGYFLAVAAALRQHGTLITRRDRAEVNAVLLELAAAAPPPYCDLLREAAAAEA